MLNAKETLKKLKELSNLNIRLSTQNKEFKEININCSEDNKIFIN